MATSAILTYHNGKLEIPEELREQLRLVEGARLQVVSSGFSRIVLYRAESGSRTVGTDLWADLKEVSVAMTDHRTPEWLVKATERNAEPQKNLTVSTLPEQPVPQI